MIVDGGGATEREPRRDGVALVLGGGDEARRRAVAFALEERLSASGRIAHVLFAGEGSAVGLAAAARACSDAGIVTICLVGADRAAAEVRERVGAARLREATISDEPLDAAVARLAALLDQ
jgi:hypothetical protein